MHSTMDTSGCVPGARLIVDHDPPPMSDHNIVSLPGYVQGNNQSDSHKDNSHDLDLQKHGLNHGD